MLSVSVKKRQRGEANALENAQWEKSYQEKSHGEETQTSEYNDRRLVAEYFDQRDEQVMQALVTAGAFVALADGRVKDIERDELLSYVDAQDLVPTIAQQNSRSF